MAAFLELEQYIMYLRKSRMDTDFEEVSMEETLSRHKKILNDFCKARKLNVVEVLEEVVSGESLSARPKMQRLLELVRTGLYAGVVCKKHSGKKNGKKSECINFYTEIVLNYTVNKKTYKSKYNKCNTYHCGNNGR